MKTILVIGIGKFGHHFAEKLIALGNEVMIIDRDEDKIRELMSKATSARIGDCTDEDVLNNLGLSNFDTVAVCISEDFQNSIETTSLVKELGAKHVISVASRDIHAKLLLKNGADEVIYPDRDIAYRLAKKYSRSHVFEYIELSDEYAIFEVPVIPQLVGKSIREADVRKKYKMNIAAHWLLNENMKIGDIAVSLGYNNASKFAIAFQSVYGILPKDYRKQK